jgi:hypothetical protein
MATEHTSWLGQRAKMIPPGVRCESLSGTRLFFFCPATLHAPQPKIVWNDQETPILEQMRTLRERSEQQKARIGTRITKRPCAPDLEIACDAE